jgi:hypothetical protein
MIRMVPRPNQQPAAAIAAASPAFPQQRQSSRIGSQALQPGKDPLFFG